MSQKQQEHFYQVVGSLIKNYRAKAGLNQTTLAARLKLSRTSIVNIEQGRQHPSLFLLWQIADSLDTTINCLLPGKDDLVAVAVSDVNQKSSTVETSDFKKALTEFINDL